MTYRSKQPPSDLTPEAQDQWNNAFGNMTKRPKQKQTPANKLTDEIREMLELKYFAVTARVSTMGVWSEKLQKHIHGGATLGFEDIDCVIPMVINKFRIGMKIAIEVKAGKDQMSPKQLKRKNDLHSVGALYIEARSVDQVDGDIGKLLRDIYNAGINFELG